MVTTPGSPVLVEQATGTTLTIGVPSGATPGELLIASIGISGDTVTPPTGWTQIVFVADAAASVASGGWYRIVTGSETADYTWTVPNGRSTGIMHRAAGVDASTVLDVTASTATVATGGSVSAPSVTVVTDGAMLVSGGAVLTASANTLVVPSGMTQLSASTGTGRRHALADQVAATAGATGVRTWTSSGTTLPMVAWLAALRPEATVRAATAHAGVGIAARGMRQTPYQAAVAASSPSVWWHLDEPAGDFVDVVGGLHAVPSGAVIPRRPGIGTGRNANDPSAAFDDAVMSYAETAAASAFTPTQLTVEALAQSDGVSGNNRIVQNGPDTSWQLLYEDGSLKFTVFGLASADYTWAGDSAPHHVAGTYDGLGTARLYLDGTQVGIEVGTGTGGPASTTDPLRIGQKPTGSTPGDGWNGRIDEVSIYPSVLTAGTIYGHAAAAGLATVDARSVSGRVAVGVAAAGTVRRAARSMAASTVGMSGLVSGNPYGTGPYGDGLYGGAAAVHVATRTGTAQADVVATSAVGRTTGTITTGSVGLGSAVTSTRAVPVGSVSAVGVSALVGGLAHGVPARAVVGLGVTAGARRVAPVAGAGTVGVRGVGVSVHVAAGQAQATTGATTTGTAGRVAPVAGSGTAGVGCTGTAVRFAPVTGRAAVGSSADAYANLTGRPVTGRGTVAVAASCAGNPYGTGPYGDGLYGGAAAVHVAVRSGTSASGAVVSAGVRRIAVVTATSTVGAKAAGTVRRVSPVDGHATVGVSAAREPSTVRPVATLVCVGATTTGTARRVAPVAGSSMLGGSAGTGAVHTRRATGTAGAGACAHVVCSRRAVGSATASTGMSARGIVRHTAGASARGHAAAAAHAACTRTFPVTGRGTVGVSTVHYAGYRAQALHGRSWTRGARARTDTRRAGRSTVRRRS